jgi:phosphatase and actin regulator
MENKENARPYGSSNGSAGTSHDDDDSDSNDGPILYRDDPVGGGTDRAAKVARKESLSLKLQMRPDRQELINRNILRLQHENEQQERETKEAIGARLIRRLSMRPTAEELVERNILKSKFWSQGQISN